MNALRKSLNAVAVIFAMVPAAAFAYPPQCYDICYMFDCTGSCFVRTIPTTCEAWGGYCSSPAQPSQETASVSSEQAQWSEDTAPVCDAAHPEVEQAPAAES
ncbi:hypothetical protein [Corallococcus exiguus]|uniref:Uncharacterized protein n=1 Tax=Corallococcus exiguus TaxID=83462 RepID=A0A7X5BVG2_9BACT|nr:hypothetical protein [Corallococcus exiguus]NBC45405.1 hypothetical protein [Corallococcus exiguus]TNV61568.1 hypothetical protein FH620_20760 [Corallococcus exiguus]